MVMADLDVNNIREDLSAIKSDIATIRKEIRDSMIAVAVIQAKLGFIAGGVAIVCSVLVQAVSRLFF